MPGRRLHLCRANLRQPGRTLLRRPAGMHRLQCFLQCFILLPALRRVRRGVLRRDKLQRRAWLQQHGAHSDLLRVRRGEPALLRRDILRFPAGLQQLQDVLCLRAFRAAMLPGYARPAVHRREYLVQRD